MGYLVVELLNSKGDLSVLVLVSLVSRDYKGTALFC